MRKLREEREDRFAPVFDPLCLKHIAHPALVALRVKCLIVSNLQRFRQQQLEEGARELHWCLPRPPAGRVTDALGEVSTTEMQQRGSIRPPCSSRAAWSEW